jgi:hypothetical protein
MTRRTLLLVSALSVLCSVRPAHAQVSTGTIAGVIEDAGGAVLPGVSVSLTGERLIGGTATQVSDGNGAYRFDRLSPGSYSLKFALQGFRTVERRDIVVSASFTATVNLKLEVGALQETITVAGESPTVDVKSNLQQTVMSQEILEGVPTDEIHGRWQRSSRACR